MSDFYFAAKTLVITLLITILMQIKVGPSTIEQHSLAWIQSSSVVSGLRDISNGAIKASSQAIRWMSGSIDASWNRAFRKENAPGSRLPAMRMERSSSVRAADDAKRRAAEEAADKAADAADARASVASEHL